GALRAPGGSVGRSGPPSHPRLGTGGRSCCPENSERPCPAAMTASSTPHVFAGDVQFGYLDRTWQAPRVHHPQLIVNTPPNTMLRVIRDELRRANSFLFSVAFVTPRAIALLKQELVEFEGPGVIVTSDYLGFNSPAAFHELLGLRSLGIDVRRHTATEF